MRSGPPDIPAGGTGRGAPAAPHTTQGCHAALRGRAALAVPPPCTSGPWAAFHACVGGPAGAAGGQTRCCPERLPCMLSFTTFAGAHGGTNDWHAAAAAPPSGAGGAARRPADRQGEERFCLPWPRVLLAMTPVAAAAAAAYAASPNTRAWRRVPNRALRPATRCRQPPTAMAAASRGTCSTWIGSSR